MPKFQAALLPTHPPAEGGAQSLELSVVNSRGERLQGLLLDTGSEDVVILCHGCVAFNGADLLDAVEEIFGCRPACPTAACGVL